MIKRSLKLMRFLVSGSIGAATNIAALYICTDIFGVWYIYSGIIAFLASTAVSFVLQKLWTFKDRSKERIKRQAALYLSLATFNLGINTILLYVFTDVFHVYYILSQIITSILIAFGSYFAYNFIFNKDMI
jgi:putative flippase GtrA